jgi:hypothetical protein
VNVRVLVWGTAFPTLSRTADRRDKPGHLFGELTAKVKATIANQKRTTTAARRMMYPRVLVFIRFLHHYPLIERVSFITFYEIRRTEFRTD